MTTQQGLQASPATMPSERKGGIPRGLKMTGPVILSYGFRPFFLGGAIWAVMAMLLWILSSPSACRWGLLWSPQLACT